MDSPLKQQCKIIIKEDFHNANDISRTEVEMNLMDASDIMRIVLACGEVSNEAYREVNAASPQI